VEKAPCDCQRAVDENQTSDWHRIEEERTDKNHDGLISRLNYDSEKMNPLWNPVRMNREQGRDAKPSSVTGHMICVDGFGPPSADERKAGLPFNGEAITQKFDVQSSKNGSTAEETLRAKLPIVQEEVTRTLRMVDGENVVYVESQLENLMGFDPPINWGEHATIGSPFLEPGVTVVDLSGGRCQTTDYANAPPGGPANSSTQRRLASGKEFQWPIAPGLGSNSVDMRQTPENPNYVDHTGAQMDPARKLEWATALNPKRIADPGLHLSARGFPLGADVG
jgi:hypothetical protein